MNKITTIASLAIISAFMVACSKKTQTVEQCVTHSNVLKQGVQKCKLKPLAELAQDRHCTVIRVAEQKAFDEHQINAQLPNFHPK